MANETQTNESEAQDATLRLSPLMAESLAQSDQADTAPALRQGPTWMVSFTDLVALLLTFFVMVFAMRDVEEDTWQSITNSFVTALDQMTETTLASPRFEIDIDRITDAEGQDLDYLRTVIESLAEEGEMPSFMTLAIEGDGVAIRAPRSAIIQPDQLALSEPGRRYVFHLAEVLGNLANAVELIIRVPGEASDGPTTRAWTDGLRLAAYIKEALRESGYGDPMEIRARWQSSGQDTVDILILPDARR